MTQPQDLGCWPMRTKRGCPAVSHRWFYYSSAPIGSWLYFPSIGVTRSWLVQVADWPMLWLMTIFIASVIAPIHLLPISDTVAAGAAKKTFEPISLTFILVTILCGRTAPRQKSLISIESVLYFSHSTLKSPRRKTFQRTHCLHHCSIPRSSHDSPKKSITSSFGDFLE